MNLMPIGLSLNSEPCSFGPRLSVWIYNCPAYVWLQHNLKKISHPRPVTLSLFMTIVQVSFYAQNKAMENSGEETSWKAAICKTEEEMEKSDWILRKQSVMTWTIFNYGRSIYNGFCVSSIESSGYTTSKLVT